jgi:hypothetical protein
MTNGNGSNGKDWILRAMVGTLLAILAGMTTSAMKQVGDLREETAGTKATVNGQAHQLDRIERNQGRMESQLDRIWERLIHERK